MHSRLPLIALAILILTCAPAATAQTLFEVSGTVTDSSGEPLPGVTVELELPGKAPQVTVTNAAGEYRFEYPPPSPADAELELTAALAGFRGEEKAVRAAPANEVDFALQPSFHESITVGSRAGGTADEQAVPVDVFDIEQIETSGASETNQILQALAPSFNFPRPTITDGTDSVRPATLRGLGPDQVLVLINGKRRHTSALVHVNNSIGRGSTGVDINAIPASAIQKVEILRDGAAAQYGSDAIAGVINIVLKSGDTPVEVRAKGGATTHSDGALFDASVAKGWDIGDGWFFATAEYRDRSETNRAGADPREQGSVNPVPQPNHHWGDSDAKDILGFFNASMPLDADQNTWFYAFGGASEREGSHGGFYRRALDNRNQPAIYPDGFLPLIEPDVSDFSTTVGVRGLAGDWFWDVSSGYGDNSFDFTVNNSLNASLGPSIPPNQTSFDSGGLGFDQWVTNFDVSRKLDLGLAGPINIALGAELREEGYQIRAGEPNSYLDGGFPNQSGGQAAAGAQVFPGFRPANEVDASRTSYALYVDFEGNVLPLLRVDLAGRFEDYDDFGTTSDGKLALRLQASEDVVLRAAFSTGFRAPSLGQSFFSATSTNFLNDPVTGQLVPFEVGTFPVSSPVARALGAQELRPEETTHYSAGLAWQATPAFFFGVDYFRIDIDDRIVFSGNFTGGQVAELLEPFNVNGARFFTNAIKTETTGIDVTASYALALGDLGRLDLSAAYSNADTEIVGQISTPSQLAGLEETLFDRIERRRLECAQPEDNLRLTGNWRRGKLGTVLRASRYGEYCNFSGSPELDQTYGAEWLTDLEVSYDFGTFLFALGVQNLADNFPDRNIAPNSFNGIFTYPSNSPFGMNGRFAYSRIVYQF